MIFEEQIKEIPVWNPTQLNPALLTLVEYTKIANEHEKFHPSSAYDFDLEKMNSWGSDKSKYQLVKRLKIHGLTFELMVKTTKRHYGMTYIDENGSEEYIRINDQIQYYNDKQIKEMGLQPLEYSIAIFHDDKRVALAEDEWGALLIAVAREYRNFGLGTIIGKYARSLEPSKSSGGFTNSGYANFRRIHSSFVRDALKNGLYSKLIRQGVITKEKVKDIIASLDKKPEQSNFNLNSNDPKDWLLFFDGYGSFILYDRKLVDIINENQYEHFIENMIKGFVYVHVDTKIGISRIKHFGGDSMMVKSFMLGLAYTYAKTNHTVLWVEPDEYDIKGFQYGREEKVVGYSSKPVIDGRLIDFGSMVKDEDKFRKSFDRYGEFKDRLLELAEGKW